MGFWRLRNCSALALTYWDQCPYQIGDAVVSPVRDDETQCEFEGRGKVTNILTTEQELGIVRYDVTVTILEGAESELCSVGR